MTELYLIRHSHTESNGFYLLSGIEECELTAFGKRQIDAVFFTDKKMVHHGKLGDWLLEEGTDR